MMIQLEVCVADSLGTSRRILLAPKGTSYYIAGGLLLRAAFADLVLQVTLLSLISRLRQLRAGTWEMGFQLSVSSSGRRHDDAPSQRSPVKAGAARPLAASDASGDPCRADVVEPAKRSSGGVDRRLPPAAPRLSSGSNPAAARAEEEEEEGRSVEPVL
eukprot:3748700-Rhodomonas_salina.2